MVLVCFVGRDLVLLVWLAGGPVFDGFLMGSEGSL